MCYIQPTVFFMSSAVTAIALMKVLQHELVTLGSTEPKDLDKKVQALVESHRRIIEFVKELDDIVAISVLFELLTFGLMIIALLYLVSNVNQSFKQTRHLISI